MGMGRVVLAKRKRATIEGAFGRQLLSNLLSGKWLCYRSNH
jgi:hypothetical protein